MVRVLLLVFLVFGSGLTRRVSLHEESGEWSCKSSSEIRVQADFRPGVITLDGHADDWIDIDGFEFSLLPALDPDEDHEYKDGKMTVKALHNGNDVFFLLQVYGNYAFSKGDSRKCPSVALMFQIGVDATYHNMGGCKEPRGSCTNKTCKGHEVDIMHFSIGNAIPGRLYGGNPIDNRDGNGGDRFGHLVDVYAWNPHCRYIDGVGPSDENDGTSFEYDKTKWDDAVKIVPTGVIKEMILVHRITGKGHGGTVASQFIQALWRKSPYSTGGQKGMYYFEFSRPLRTMDHLQQDVLFTIGGSSKMSVAFWYPIDGNPWHGAGHYSINCDWVSLDIASGGSMLAESASSSSWDATSAFALLFSIAALCIAIFVAYQISRRNSVPFTPMENL